MRCASSTINSGMVIVVDFNIVFQRKQKKLQILSLQNNFDVVCVVNLFLLKIKINELSSVLVNLM